MKINLFTLFMVSLLTVNCLLVGQETKSKVLKEIDSAADKFVKRYQVPGLSLAIGRNGELAYAQGFGKSDLENSVQASKETVYRTASIAKPITAIAVLQLVEQGKISLDDSIKKHCPEFPAMDDAPTIRHLLCHQGGIRHYKFSGEASGKKFYTSIKDSLELFKDDRLLFKPGEKYSYTTYGYSLLGRAIETASGMSYRDYLQKNIFETAKMDSATIDDWFQIIPNRTRGYTRLSPQMHARLPQGLQAKLRVGQVFNCELHDTSMKVPGGGLICSAIDLVKLGQSMLADRLIKSETKQLAWTPQNTNDGKATRYGLGWNIAQDGAKIVSHSGGQAGTSTFLLIVPKHDIVVSVMCNMQGAPTAQLARDIGRLYVTQDSK